MNKTDLINQFVIGCGDIVKKTDLINQCVIGCDDILKKKNGSYKSVRDWLW